MEVAWLFAPGTQTQRLYNPRRSACATTLACCSHDAPGISHAHIHTLKPTDNIRNMLQAPKLCMQPVHTIRKTALSCSQVKTPHTNYNINILQNSRAGATLGAGLLGVASMLPACAFFIFLRGLAPSPLPPCGPSSLSLFDPPAS